MNFSKIDVPDYVAEEFNKPLRHPNSAPDAVERSLLRVYKLINEALKDKKFSNWEVDNHRYHSYYEGESITTFYRVDNKFYVGALERGVPHTIAIFKSAYTSADYFVWLVSEGKAQIDWSLFLDMEP